MGCLTALCPPNFVRGWRNLLSTNGQRGVLECPKAVEVMRFGSLPLQVMSMNVPTPNAYAVQIEAPAAGSWLTITRKEVQATAPVPDTYGTPFAWQGSLPVPYGVLNLWNGNLLVGLGLFGWGGQVGVAFGLTYNAQDSEQGVLGVGWRHSYEASLVVSQRQGQQLVVVLEPDGRRLEYAEQPDGSYVAPRGVYSQLRFVGGRYELVRPSQERWVNDANQLARIADSVGRAVELAYYGVGDMVPGTNTPVPAVWYGQLKWVEMRWDASGSLDTIRRHEVTSGWTIRAWRAMNGSICDG
jgi:hypothetical protein